MQDVARCVCDSHAGFVFENGNCYCNLEIKLEDSDFGGCRCSDSFYVLSLDGTKCVLDCNEAG